MNEKYRIFYQNKYYISSTSWEYASNLDKRITVVPTSDSAWRTCMELEKQYPMYIFRYDSE